MKKILSLIVCVMLAIGALSAMPAFAAADDAYLTTDAAGGWYTGTQVVPGESGEHAIHIMPSGGAQTLWGMHIQITPWDYMAENGGLTTWRYLHYKTDGNLTKFASAFSHGYDASKEKPLPMEAGEHVVDIIELAGEDAVKNGEMLDVYWYLAVAAPEGSEFEYMYISQSAEKDTNDTPPEDDPVESTPEETPVESTPEETPVESTPEETPVESTPEEDPVESTPEETPVESTPDTDDAVSSESTTGNAPTGPSVGIIIAIVAAVVIIAGAVVVTLVVLKKKAAPAAEAAEESTEE